MVPTLFARFLTNGPVLFEKAKDVALAQGYAVSVNDSENGILHLHKKESGRMVHLVVYIGSKSERALAVEVIPGDEGLYMDYGREYIDGLRKAIR
jgi:hypothetical protein